MRRGDGERDSGAACAGSWSRYPCPRNDDPAVQRKAHPSRPAPLKSLRRRRASSWDRPVAISSPSNLWRRTEEVRNVGSLRPRADGKALASSRASWLWIRGEDDSTGRREARERAEELGRTPKNGTPHALPEGRSRDYSALMQAGAPGAVNVSGDVRVLMDAPRTSEDHGLSRDHRRGVDNHGRASRGKYFQSPAADGLATGQ